ncbi:hypothetical protein M446_1512 [Methylobacterium sp. 4-46]|nr:hypothetical protein M446_1512 [Methylobacterium sp. 4-46]
MTGQRQSAAAVARSAERRPSFTALQYVVNLEPTGSAREPRDHRASQDHPRHVAHHDKSNHLIPSSRSPHTRCRNNQILTATISLRD